MQESKLPMPTMLKLNWPRVELIKDLWLQVDGIAVNGPIFVYDYLNPLYWLKFLVKFLENTLIDRRG